MKFQLGEQRGLLTDMQGELLRLQAALVAELARGPAVGHPADTPKKRGKLLKMKVIQKEAQQHSPAGK
jgi:hypothetical protein